MKTIRSSRMMYPDCNAYSREPDVPVQRQEPSGRSAVSFLILAAQVFYNIIVIIQYKSLHYL